MVVSIPGVADRQMFTSENILRLKGVGVGWMSRGSLKIVEEFMGRH